MNKYQIKLLELVSDYADKELREGCYVKTEDYWAVFQLIEEPSNYLETYTDTAIADISYWENDWKIIEKWNFKILWKLDLSAILKFVDCIDYTIEFYREELVLIDYLNSTNRCDECDNAFDWKIMGRIPNKCPTRYTEEEAKEVYNLLKKIWKTSK